MNSKEWIIPLKLFEVNKSEQAEVHVAFHHETDRTVPVEIAGNFIAVSLRP